MLTGSLALAWWLGAAGPTVSTAQAAATSKDSFVLGAEATAAARRDATTMYDAFKKGDFTTFAHFTYPHLLDMVGGTERLVETMTKGLAQMKESGFVVKAVTIDAPTQAVQAGPELHALLPLQTVLAAPGGELHSRSFLLGISVDKGKNWTFIDTSTLDKNDAREYVPNYNFALKLPKKSEPVFIKN